MADDRMMQSLEEQLPDSHATKAELRERLAAADRQAKNDNYRVVEASAAQQFMPGPLRLALRIR